MAILPPLERSVSPIRQIANRVEGEGEGEGLGQPAHHLTSPGPAMDGVGSEGRATLPGVTAPAHALGVVGKPAPVGPASAATTSHRSCTVARSTVLHRATR